MGLSAREAHKSNMILTEAHKSNQKLGDAHKNIDELLGP